MDGQLKDHATVEEISDSLEDVFDQIAAELYNLASMLVGEGEASIRLVESVIANAEVSPCCDPGEGRRNSRRALCAEAIGLLGKRGPVSLVAPEGMAPAETCLDEDDLAVAGVSRADLDRAIRGPNRDRIKDWLSGLATANRTIFVLRAVAGFTAAETADLLADHGGAQAAGWTADAVRELFRRGLCSLASQLIQASAAR